jgi:V8-like Glu-specific endopeptidase
MSDPALQPTSTPLMLGKPYIISSLFTYVPGTGPDGEAVVGVRVGFYPTSNEVFSPSTPDVSGLDDFRVAGDLSGVGANGDPSWDSGTVTFTGPSNTTALSLSGYLQFIIAPSTQFPRGWVFADSVGYTFHFGSALFTTGADTVNFNALTSDQQAAIANGADTTHGLGGNDVVTLPNSGAATFFTGSTIADNNYRVIGGSGNYDIVEGAGTEFITINGNGNSNITAGSGADTISVSGTGHSVVNGNLTGSVSISGGGFLQFVGTLNGTATLNAGSTLELGGIASLGGTVNGSITFTDDTGTLQIDGTAMPASTIVGFVPGDQIILKDVPFSSLTGATLFETGNKLQIVENGNQYTLQLDPNLQNDFSLNVANKGFSFGLSQETGGSGTVIHIEPEQIQQFKSGNSGPGYSAGAYPYGQVVDLQTSFPFPSPLDEGTGFIIGPHTILTASHLLFDTAGNEATGISISGALAGVGNYSLSTLVNVDSLVHTGLTASQAGDLRNNPSSRFDLIQNDYALIDVAATLPLGPLVFGLDSAGFAGSLVNITGYPGNVPDGIQTNDIGTVAKNPNWATFAYLNAQVTGGNSGGPLWIYDGSTAQAVGIVSTNFNALQLTATEVAQFKIWETNDAAILGVPSAPNPTPPGGTTANMIMRDASSGRYEIYNIGNNLILAGYGLGQVGLDWQFVGLGGFYGTDTSDMILRNSSTGAFEFYNISNNNVTNAALLGTVGLDWQFGGFGDFSSRPGETDMILRNSSTAALEVYDISNNSLISAYPMGAVGLNWQVAGFGDFSSSPNETDMIMRNDNTGALEVYNIANNALTSAYSMGAVGLDWQVAGFGNFSSRANETDMIMRNSNTGALEVYDIANNSLISAYSMGAVGLDWQVVGFGNFSGNANETDMIMRNSNSGALEVYDIANNALAAAYSAGAVGLNWEVGGIAPEGRSASTASMGDSSQVASLVQAMAGLDGSAAAGGLSTVAIGADTAQQQFLTMPQHA